MPRQFPPGFVWGAATAAHQVEGQNFNSDWWEWEQTPGHIKNGDTSRVACDWWPRFGLYNLDVETQTRTPRPVAQTYACIIRENGIADDLM